MDLGTMRTLVRRDLKDEDSSDYRWQDNEIERAIARALYELSRYVPREMKNTIATTDGSRDIDISSLTDRVSVDRVEFPVGETPRSYQRFAVYSDIITMIGDAEGDGEDSYIYWGKVHTLDVTTSTIPSYLEDVLALGAAAFAVLAQAQLRTDAAGFGGEQADRDYLSWGNTMLKEFKAQLKRFGRGRKLKISQFYQGDDNE
ncbi:MAG: hypothetical protein H8D32_01205 [Dehalococcoidia bacterium]|nr:hypothetical protein [Dehalococcoidia bacterium]